MRCEHAQAKKKNAGAQVSVGVWHTYTAHTSRRRVLIADAAEPPPPPLLPPISYSSLFVFLKEILLKQKNLYLVDKEISDGALIGVCRLLAAVLERFPRVPLPPELGGVDDGDTGVEARDRRD